MTPEELEETPERALAKVIDRQARDIERLRAEVERLRDRQGPLEELALQFGGLHEMSFPIPVEMEHRYEKCVGALAALEERE